MQILSFGEWSMADDCCAGKVSGENGAAVICEFAIPTLRPEKLS
jgi:hypothetical protein